MLCTRTSYNIPKLDVNGSIIYTKARIYIYIDPTRGKSSTVPRYYIDRWLGGDFCSTYMGTHARYAPTRCKEAGWHYIVSVHCSRLLYYYYYCSVYTLYTYMWGGVGHPRHTSPRLTGFFFFLWLLVLLPMTKLNSTSIIILYTVHIICYNADAAHTLYPLQQVAVQDCSATWGICTIRFVIRHRVAAEYYNMYIVYRLYYYTGWFVAHPRVFHLLFIYSKFDFFQFLSIYLYPLQIHISKRYLYMPLNRSVL